MFDSALKFARQRLTKAPVGTILIAVSVVGLYGWVNSIEPDCYYSTKVGLQIRLCGENYVGREFSASLWALAGLFLVLVAGITLRMRRVSSDDKEREPDGD